MLFVSQKPPPTIDEAKLQAIDYCTNELGNKHARYSEVDVVADDKNDLKDLGTVTGYFGE
jgi:hypothetical protein